MTAPSLSVEGLAFSYPDGHQALFGVDLRVERGERVAVLGPNGAGKTTCTRVITGALGPDAGAVRVFGLDPATDGPEVRRRIGIVSAIVGIGGGSLTVPLLVWRGVAPVRAVGTSSACGIFIGLGSALGYALQAPAGALPLPGAVGYVYLPAAIGMAQSVEGRASGSMANRIGAAVSRSETDNQESARSAAPASSCSLI